MNTGQNAHIQDEILYFAFDEFDNVRHLNKDKDVIFQITSHSASQLLVTFEDFWIIENAQLYVPVWPRASCEVPDSKRSLYAFYVAMSLAINLGWTFIHNLKHFLSGLEEILIHILWKSSMVPLSHGLFTTIFLTSYFVTTCITPLFVDTLNSLLRNTNTYRNFTHRMAMSMAKHDCPFLPLSRTVTFTHLDAQFSVETKMSHWTFLPYDHVQAECSQLSTWLNCCAIGKSLAIHLCLRTTVTIFFVRWAYYVHSFQVQSGK